jgi:hypothetical protein
MVFIQYSVDILTIDFFSDLIFFFFFHHIQICLFEETLCDLYFIVCHAILKQIPFIFINNIYTWMNRLESLGIFILESRKFVEWD